MTPLSFEIARIETFHVASGERYWKGYRTANRQESDRFILKPGWRTVYGQRVETCLVKVTLANGQSGWGEATEPVCPEVIGQLIARLIAPLCKDVKFDSVGEFTTFAYDLNRGRGHQSGYMLLAIAALDIAICDALAKTAGKPLAALFGHDPKPEIPLYLSGIRRTSLAERQALMNELVEDGLTAAKIFVDGDNDETMAEVDALQAGITGDWSLMVDCLWSCTSVEQAADLAERLGERGVKWLECPLIPEDLDGHSRLRAGSPTPIALGETFFTGYQLRDWMRGEAFDIYQPDIGRTGYAEGLDQAKQVQDAGLIVTPHMGSGSPVVQAAALHFHAAVCAGQPCEYQRDLAGFLPDAFHSHWNMDHSTATLPDRPGLGVEVDETALSNHVVEHLIHDLTA